MRLRALILLLCLGTLALGQEAKVRTSLDTKGDLWVGQRLTVVVELMAPGFFANSAAFDLPNTPGLILAPPEGSPVVSSEVVDGVNYTVQRHEVSAFARRVGEQSIPSFAVRFQFKRNPLDKESVAAAVKTEPLRFTVQSPPGAEHLGNLISAKELKVEENWQPVPGNAKAGDGFTRTITYSAPDVPGMAFPPFPAIRVDGLGVYPKPPEVLDQSERGELTGRRRDTVTFVCQRAGRFTIPAQKLTWYDLESKQLQTITFPERTFVVAPNPTMPSAAAPEPMDDRRDWQSIAVALGAIVGVNLLCFALWKMRAFWVRIWKTFSPVHLAPLNPGQRGDAP